MDKTKMVHKIGLSIGEKKITECIYDSGEIVNGVALMITGTELHVFDEITGDLKFKLDYIKKVRYSNNSLIVTSAYGAIGVYDIKGRNLVPLMYDEIRNRGDYYVGINRNDTSILYKRDEEKGKADIIIPKEKGFNEIKLCNEGVIVANSNEKYGVYSYDGEELISPEYDLIQPFGYSYLVGIKKDEQITFGLYSSSGKNVYESVYIDFKLDLPLVYLSKDNKWCAYNMYTEKEVAKLKYQKITRFDNVIAATKDGHSYFIHSAEDGKMLIESPFDKISMHSHKLILLETIDRCNFYYLTRMGKFIDADSYEVKHKDYKYYIRKIIRYSGKQVELPWELVNKEELY